MDSHSGNTQYALRCAVLVVCCCQKEGKKERRKERKKERAPVGVVAVVQVFFTCTRCAPRCTRLSFFAEGSLHVVSPSTARPRPSLRARRADAPTTGPTPLSVAHAGSRAACSPPVRLGHLGRTVDVVSGVHVRPGQRCSETPPVGAAPRDTPWLQTASALRALKSRRAELPPMARTGFGPLKVRILPGPY